MSSTIALAATWAQRQGLRPRARRLPRGVRPAHRPHRHRVRGGRPGPRHPGIDVVLEHRLRPHRRQLGPRGSPRSAATHPSSEVGAPTAGQHPALIGVEDAPGRVHDQPLAGGAASVPEHELDVVPRELGPQRGRRLGRAPGGPRTPRRGTCRSDRRRTPARRGRAASSRRLPTMSWAARRCALEVDLCSCEERDRVDRVAPELEVALVEAHRAETTRPPATSATRAGRRRSGSGRRSAGSPTGAPPRPGSARTPSEATVRLRDAEQRGAGEDGERRGRPRSDGRRTSATITKHELDEERPLAERGEGGRLPLDHVAQHVLPLEELDREHQHRWAEGAHRAQHHAAGQPAEALAAPRRGRPPSRRRPRPARRGRRGRAGTSRGR